MDLDTWLARHGGLARREQAMAAGFTAHAIRTADARRLGNGWLATTDAPADLLLAASSSARLACVSAAVRLRLAVLHAPTIAHLHLDRHSGRKIAVARLHRAAPIVPVGRFELVESIPDLLLHVSECLPRLEALIVWESAIRRRLVTPAALRRIDWPRRAAVEIAAAAQGRSDSLLETIAFHRLAEAGIAARQQVRILGHAVDLLLGERLVVQLDGKEFHDSLQDRSRDYRHDARLVLEGYTVLRFDYHAVVNDWPRVLATIRLAMAEGRHR